MTTSDRQRTYDSFRNIAYYIIIGVVSILATAFVPMLGSEVGLSFNWPTTTAGWIVWGLTKAIVAIINMLMFYCFMEQAKLNVRENEHFKKACDILQRIKKSRELKPRSPRAWQAKQYLSKGTMIALCSILSAIGLTQAILTFDLVAFLCYTFTILMGLLFGYLQMRKAESYWTEEYYEYALMVEKEEQEAKSQMEDK